MFILKFKFPNTCFIFNVISTPEYDKYIKSEVILPREGGQFQSANIIRRATKSDGTSVGSYNDNPIIYTRIYEVIFNDGSTQEYATNCISLSNYDQVDENGYKTILLDSIQQHWKNDTAVGSSDGYTKDKRRRK